jgi:hypothetical protein
MESAVSDASMAAGWNTSTCKTTPNKRHWSPVTLSVVDSNGNYRDIGITSTNTDSFFGFDWKPDIEGKYTVYASFGGSASY